MNSDIVIAGGGPAGLLAGIRLARAGYRVDLFEEHPEIGEPVHCTGVLAREAFQEFGLPATSVLNPLTTVNFFSPTGEPVEYTTPTIEAVVIDRAVFDRELADAAVASGVTMHRARVLGLEVDAEGVTVTSAGSAVRSRACILACGANYALQRKLGLGMPRLMLNSAQMELPASRLGPVEVHFGADVAPSGFAWAVPVDRADGPSVRIGVMCEGDSARYFRRMVELVGARWGVAVPDRAPRQKVLPLAPIPCTYSDRVLVLGDAAGLVKPTTGGGIYYSLLSAEIGAETLGTALAQNDLRAARLAAYETRWRKRLGSELRWQLVLRRIAQRLSDSDIDRLFELARTDGIMPIVRRTATFNQHRDFIVALLKHPPARRVLFRAALA
ncbi:MAG TPA: NAD(P)/FAD-dependent oxidoreductase [Vicinamibacterales bacterium]|nr:NAD(P)/FAD-dependent oxidoreductase [Vicinamibacterales bacterium]